MWQRFLEEIEPGSCSADRSPVIAIFVNIPINFRRGELRMRIEDPDILTLDPFLDDRDVFVGPIRILG